MREHQVVPAAQDGAALLGRAAAPARPGRLGRVDGAARFVRAHVGHVADHLAGGGVGDGEGGAAVGVAPAAGEEGLLAQEGGAFQCEHGWFCLRRRGGRHGL